MAAFFERHSSFAALALIASARASVAAIVQTRESAIETRATLEQTRIVSKQLGSSLRPYVTFREAIGPHGITIGFANDGLGPALVRSFSVFEDGRPQARLREIGALLDANTSRRVGESDLGIGSVMRLWRCSMSAHRLAPRSLRRERRA